MRYLSLFSGIEAATVAWEPLGWTPVAFAEVDPFPSAVLAHRYPNVPNLGDVSQVTTEQLAALGRVDLIVGGFPCQDLSVAGKREGFEGTRSSLFFEMVRITDAIRPDFLLWENVPGLLSSRNGRDFAAVLMALDAIRYSGAWTCLDAQWFGLAQRRQRIFGLFARSHIGAGCCAEILSFRARMRGNPAPSRETGQGSSASIEGGFRSSGHGGYAEGVGAIRAHGGDAHGGSETLIAAGVNDLPETCGALSDGAHYGGGKTGTTPTQAELSRCLNAGGMGRQDFETETLIPVTGGFFDQPAHALRADGFDASEDGTGRGTPIIPILESGKRCGTRDSARDGIGIGQPDDPMFTLQSGAQHAVAISEPIPLDMRQASRGERMTNDRSQSLSSGGAPGTGIGNAGDPCPTLAESHPPAIAFQRKYFSGRKEQGGAPSPVAQTLTSAQSERSDGEIAVAYQENHHAQDQMQQMRRGANDRTESRCDGEGDGRENPVSELYPTAFQTRIARNGRGQPEQIAPTLQGASAGATSDMRPCVNSGMAVRRLTPTECERLQGFPESHTLVPYNGKPAKDGPRYRAIGNSMAVPVMSWIGKRIDAVRAEVSKAGAR